MGVLGARRTRGRLGFVLAAAAVVMGAAIPAEAAPRPTRAKLVTAAKKHRLKAFPSCDPFLAYVRPRVAEQVGPYGLGGGVRVLPLGAEGTPGGAAPVAAPVAGVDYSPTNVQEAGVDEPDIVKTNGLTMFTVADDRVRAIRLGGGSTRVVGSLLLGDVTPETLLLDGTRLLVIGRKQDPVGPGPVGPPDPGAPAGVAPGIVPFASSVVLTEVDVANPADMRIVAALTVDDNRVLDARLTGRSARIVMSGTLGAGLPFTDPTAAGGVDQATAANRAIVQQAPAASWVPRATLTRGGTAVSRPLLECGAIRLPARFSGLGLLTIVTVDLREGLEARDADAIVSDGDVVYASPSSMYVTTTRWFDPDRRTATLPIGPHTAIHRFDTRDPLRTRYRASGSVPGFLHRQWSMSEHRGNLRVASTESPPWTADGRGDQRSFVTVLDEVGGALITVGRAGGIGRGENVYAVRFIGDEGYVVTFRQIDPLHVLDLADPTRPRVVGELEIPGYSAYLHPVGPGRLMGVGQDADANGRITGAQVSLFDVRDPRNPRRVRHHALGPAWTEAEWDHHAFLFWPPTGLTVLPLQGQVVGVRSDTGGWFAGAVALRATGSEIDELARLEHPHRDGRDASIRRAIVARGNLYTVSGTGVLVNDLTLLTRRAWVPFG